MEKTLCILAAIIIILSAVVGGVILHRVSVFREEIRRLQEEYPLYFQLDTSEGINVLVYGDDKIDFWSVRLVSGNKDQFSIYEDTRYSYDNPPLTLEDAKTILDWYDLPDEAVILHPYDNWQVSSFKLSHLMEDPTYLPRMAEAFDNRYHVGEEFPVVYDPELDGTMPAHEES